jgi:hypothetical protein
MAGALSRIGLKNGFLYSQPVFKGKVMRRVLKIRNKGKNAHSSAFSVFLLVYSLFIPLE